MSNPLQGLPFNCRSDMVEALHRLISPLDPWRSSGAARVRLSPAGACFDHAAAELEGFARPLWGAVPAAIGGDDVLDWGLICRGLTNGTDPDHPEFWGWPTDLDQRLVELAAIGFAMLAVPERIWEPLTITARVNVITYLRNATTCQFSANNWFYFRLLMDAGMRAVGEDIPIEAGQAEREALEELYLNDGWYRDGPGRRVDHYTGFAFHTYALLLHRFAPHSDKGDHLARARLFAPQFAQWFDNQGRSLPYGRSMTYRFATVAFFGAYALADDESVLDWGILKGIVLRNLRWWGTQPIADRDGILPVGYAYPNPLMAENYNSPCSPYWALKAFLPLALPEDHPFWRAEEMLLPRLSRNVIVQRQPGFLIQQFPDQTVALSTGQESQNFRHGDEKYAKFAYSTRFAFSVESRSASLMNAALDSMLGIQAQGRAWVPRQSCANAGIAEGVLHSVWQPYTDTKIESWLVPYLNGHLRLHRLTTPVALTIVEGGFALLRRDGQADEHEISDRSAWVRSDASSLIHCLGVVPREPRVHGPDPNTSLSVSRSWVPQLIGRVDPGVTELVCYCQAGDLSDEIVLDHKEALSLVFECRDSDVPLLAIGAMTGRPNI